MYYNKCCGAGGGGGGGGGEVCNAHSSPKIVVQKQNLGKKKMTSYGGLKPIWVGF